jgi:anion-transporting  ArsA/GET3 family ATPase
MRLLAVIEQIGIAVDSLFVNRVLLEQTSCPRCSRRRKWQMATLQRLRQRYAKHQTYLVPEFPGEIAGVTALKKFTGPIWQIVE